MNDEILTNICSSDDAHQVIQEIRKLKDSLYKKEGVFDSVLASEIRYWLAVNIREEISKNTDLEKYFADVEKQVSSMREVTISIGFEPSELTIKRLSDYFKKMLGVDVFLNILSDKNLIGGMILMHNGEYANYSLKNVFENTFEAERETFRKMLFHSTSGSIGTVGVK